MVSRYAHHLLPHNALSHYNTLPVLRNQAPFGANENPLFFNLIYHYFSNNARRKRTKAWIGRPSNFIGLT